MATSSASSVIGCRTVAAAHELMNFFSLIFSPRVPKLQLCDSCHGHFDGLLSQHSQGEGGHGPGLGDFICKSEMTGKHPSDPTVLRHVPAREPRKVTFTSYFDNVHGHAGAAR